MEAQHKATCSSKIYKALLAKRKTLEALDTNTIQKNLIYMKEKCWKKSLKSIKLLAWRVKQRRESNLIHAIRNSDGKTVIRTDRVVQVLHKFYSELYGGKPLEVERIGKFLKSVALPSLSVEHCASLDKEITAQEVLDTIKHLKSNTAPGRDGFSPEFYKAYRDVLAPYLSGIGNRILDFKDLPSSWLESNIILFKKPERDSLNPGSYRPIALLNTDAKIITKLLANRLQKIIPLYIHADQTGFIPGRQLTDNIRRTLNVFHYAQQKQLSFVALSVDIEKAFDSVNTTYLMKTLQAMVFGNKSCNVISAFYSTPTAQLGVNGFNSSSFALRQGTHQGCPLSPLLFALAIEPLACLLRAFSGIRDVQIGPEEHKLRLYADDLVLYITDICSSLPKAQEILANFGEVSGLHVNFAKSEIFKIYITTPTELGFIERSHFKKTTQTWRYLGVNFPFNLHTIKQADYDPLIKSVKVLFKHWHQLKISWPE